MLVIKLSTKLENFDNGCKRKIIFANPKAKSNPGLVGIIITIKK